MSGKIRVRLAVLTALAAMAALVAGATVAQADPMKYLIVDVTPSSATTYVQETFTVTITNDPESNNELGAVQITSPFTITGDITIVDTSGKTWSLTWDGSSSSFRLIADTQADRLGPGETLTVEVEATPNQPPSPETEYEWLAVGRQANTFNDNFGANIVYQDLDRGHFTTTLTGEVFNCAGKSLCEAPIAAEGTSVTVSAVCDSGQISVDTRLEGYENQIGAAIVFGYLLDEGGQDCEGRIATVDFSYSKSVVSSPGGLNFAADYGTKDITSFGYPAYTNGDPFPSCNENKGIIVNCVEFVQGGSTTINAQVKMVLTDPISYSYK